MKKIIIYIMATVIVIFGFMSVGTRSYAYTEEQKQQAKAWLSAHGYSPDAGGAAAAYQDYLNGKFDEELGITREETTGSSQSAYDDSEDDDKKEKTTEESDDPVKINSVWDAMEIDKAVNTEEQTEEVTTEQEKTEIDESSTQMAYDEETYEEEFGSDVEDTIKDKEDDESGITMYLKENADKYKEALSVIVLSVLAVMIVIITKRLLAK